ncbi:MAG: hypothetical protein AAB457_00510 [Patescibacteria group bacterium]
MSESILLSRDVISLMVSAKSSIPRVKFVRVVRDTAVGDHSNQHDTIAREAGVHLLFEMDQQIRDRRTHFGSHDHGYIGLSSDRTTVYVYGKSNWLEIYDSSGAYVQRPALQDKFTGLTDVEYYRVLETNNVELARYREALEAARIDTCAVVAPLFSAVINNPQIYWSLGINEDGSPPDGAFALFKAP